MRGLSRDDSKLRTCEISKTSRVAEGFLARPSVTAAWFARETLSPQIADGVLKAGTDALRHEAANGIFSPAERFLPLILLWSVHSKADPATRDLDFHR